MGKPQVIEARILIESHPESADRTLGYVVTALKSSVRNIRGGSVAIALYDEDDQMIGMDISGSPSASFQKQVNELFNLPEDRAS